MNTSSCWIFAANYSILLCVKETHNPFYPIIILYEREVKSEVAKESGRQGKKFKQALPLVNALSLHGKFRPLYYPTKKRSSTKFSKLMFSSTKECQARSSALALPSA